MVVLLPTTVLAATTHAVAGHERTLGWLAKQLDQVLLKDSPWHVVFAWLMAKLVLLRAVAQICPSLCLQCMSLLGGCQS